MADEALAVCPVLRQIDCRGLSASGPDLVGGLELWLLTRSGSSPAHHVRAVMDFLVAEVRARTPELSGR
ncbi:MAG: hypothetical protein CM15mP21_0440 [Hyphomicrobiales bacterium]|nr:MAG: hypothetical protein CM15mP21_0440 [Hyphomicrobiales bacterium]